MASVKSTQSVSGSRRYFGGVEGWKFLLILVVVVNTKSSYRTAGP